MENKEKKIKIKTENINLFYGTSHALGDICADIYENTITAVIGPSGCGKSTFLRLFNRMNDLIPGVTINGRVLLNGEDIYGRDSYVVELRKRVGMVFQKPNIFPMSIRENVIIGPKHYGIKKKQELDIIMERSLKQAALWDEVKNNLNKPGLSLSPGEQQRLCIARALAVEPDVILFDESCSALDPESTTRIEDLMIELALKYTIIIVTHNMEQAARVSDMSAFFMIDDEKIGRLVEYSPTGDMFAHPKDKRTEDYITGRFG